MPSSTWPGCCLCHMRACYICILLFSFSFFYFHPRFEKLKKILHIEDMESKHKRMINCFKLEMERLSTRNDKEMRLNYLHRITKFFKRQQGLPPVPRLVQFCCVNVFYIKKMFRTARLRTVAFNPLLLLKELCNPVRQVNRITKFFE